MKRSRDDELLALSQAYGSKAMAARKEFVRLLKEAKQRGFDKKEKYADLFELAKILDVE
jgi:hypothetical protein